MFNFSYNCLLALVLAAALACSHLLDGSEPEDAQRTADAVAELDRLQHAASRRLAAELSASAGSGVEQ